MKTAIRFGVMAMASCISFVVFGVSVSTVSELTTAIADASSTEPSEIELAATTFELTAQITITKPITLKGASRETTIVTRKSGTIRLFQLNHADAVLKDMTIQNGNSGAACGGNILLTHGTVDNCIIQGGYQEGNGTGGSAIAVYDGENKVNSSGTIRNCIIRNNDSAPTQYEHSGYAVWCRKTTSATIDHCQFYDNSSHCYADSFKAGAAIGVYSDGAGVVVQNCTFVRNRGVGGGAIYSNKNTTQVKNSLFVGNVTRREASSANDLSGSFSSVTYCAFDRALPSAAAKASCVVGTMSFKDYANNDFTPLSYDNVAVGAGEGGTTAGAVEATSAGCFFRSSVTAARAVPFTATFTATSASAGTCSWDFGDGSATETGVEVEHEFKTAGSYTVTLTVGGATHTETIVAAPATIAVSSVEEITAAIATAGDGTVINVAAGDYKFTSGTSEAEYPYGPTALIIRKGLTLRGAADDPIQTVFRAGSNTFELDTNTSDPAKHGTKLRLLMIEHPDAKVENLTLFGGYVSGVRYFGSGVLVDYAGGTVSNCAMTACACNDNSAGGTGVCQYGGLVTHCWITNNYSKITSSDNGGGNVLLYQRGILRNSLVANNRAYCTVNKSLNTGGVNAYGSAVVENCTIVNNTGRGAGGIRQYSTTATVRNCQIQANTSLSDATYSQYQAAAAAKFVNCASTVTITGGTNCRQGELPVGNAAAGDWRPAYGSDALENGLVQDWMTGAGDLDGKPRLSTDNKVDIGCYQFQKSSVVGSFTISATEGPIPSTVAFVATASSEEGAISSYVWDFGDGSTLVETTEPTTSHQYTTIGTYLPKLNVKIGTKSYAIASTATFKAGPSVIHVVNAVSNPDEEYPYDSWTKATTNLQTALDAAVAGSRIRLSRGVHTNAVTIVVNKAIILEGETENPAETALWRKVGDASGNAKTERTLYLDNAGLCVRNLTISGGRIFDSTSTYGANFLMTGLGGVVTNCIITGGQIIGTQQNASAGSAFSIEGGLITHCVISNNSSKLSSNDNGNGGSIAQVVGGRLAFCLVTGNQVDDSILYGTSANFFGRIVSVKDGTVLHCSIVSNDVSRGWTLTRAESSLSGAIVNCLIASNKTENALAGHETAKVFRQSDGTYAMLDHCFGDAEYAAADPAKYVYDEKLSFKEVGGVKWFPKAQALAARRAAATPETVGATYLDGTPVPAKHAAAGCYPSWGKIGFLLLMR